MPRCPKCPGMLSQNNIGLPCPTCGEPIPDPDPPPKKPPTPTHDNPACQRCGARRIVFIALEADDMATATIGDHRVENDYLPIDMGIGDIEFRYCLNCGQIQGTWPVPETELERTEKEDEDA